MKWEILDFKGLDYYVYKAVFLITPNSHPLPHRETPESLTRYPFFPMIITHPFCHFLVLHVKSGHQFLQFWF